MIRLYRAPAYIVAIYEDKGDARMHLIDVPMNKLFPTPAKPYSWPKVEFKES